MRSRPASRFRKPPPKLSAKPPNILTVAPSEERKKGPHAKPRVPSDPLRQVRDTLYLAISAIAHVRGLFPEVAFKDKLLGRLPVKTLQPSTDESKWLLKRLNSIVCALNCDERIRLLIFTVCDGAKKPLEHYWFVFKHKKRIAANEVGNSAAPLTVSGERLTNGKKSKTAKLAKRREKEAWKSRTQKTLLTLIYATQVAPALPRQRCFTLGLWTDYFTPKLSLNTTSTSTAPTKPLYFRAMSHSQTASNSRGKVQAASLSKPSATVMAGRLGLGALGNSVTGAVLPLGSKEAMYLSKRVALLRRVSSRRARKNKESLEQSKLSVRKRSPVVVETTAPKPCTNMPLLSSAASSGQQESCPPSASTASHCLSSSSSPVVSNRRLCRRRCITSRSVRSDRSSSSYRPNDYSSGASSPRPALRPRRVTFKSEGQLRRREFFTRS